MPVKIKTVSFKRSYKRYLVVIGFLAVFAMVVTIQYINETQSRQILIYNNSRRISAVKSIRHSDLLSRINPMSGRAKDSLAQNALTSAFVSSITPKPNLKHLINATKTQYPLTVTASYMMENPQLCTSVQNLSVLVIVHTAPDHFDRRQTIRNTWANDTYYSHLGRVRILFLLGRVKSHDLQQRLEKEFKDHRDMVQGDFIDAYRNLTHKGVMGYKWISERCRNAKVILKVDDDVIVNMFKFFTDYMPHYKGKSKQILCNHIHPGTMLIIRERKSKWYVDESHFKGQKFYPRYCSGFMVMITNDVIPAIYRSASLTPFFWVDDVYLYGLAPGNVPGIHYNDLKKGSHQLNGQLAIKCYRNASRTCNFLVTGAGKHEVAVEIWSNMVHLYQKYLKEKRKVTTEATTSTTWSSTDFSTFEETKSVPQLAEEKAKLDLIMKDKNLIVGKLVNKIETGKQIV